MPKDKSSGKKLADMMYGSDQIRATPQSRVTGPIANALRKAQQFASQYEVSPRIPLLGGTGVDELLSLPEAASLMEDVSYNGPGALIRGGNVATGGIGTFRPDPRIASAADVAGTATGVGSLATKGATKGALAAGRAGSRLADKAVPQIMERGGLGADILSGMAQGSRSQVIKPKGGNWLGGNLAGYIDPSIARLRPYGGVEESLDRAKKSLARMEERADSFKPRDIQAQRDMVAGLEAEFAIENWVTRNLGNYVKKQMGTPEDPVRALHEQGITHLGGGIDDLSPIADQSLRQRRAEAGFPAEGMGQSEMARKYENLTDEAITSISAGDVQKSSKALSDAQEAERAFRDYQADLGQRFTDHLKSKGLSESEVATLSYKTPVLEKAYILGDKKYDELALDAYTKNKSLNRNAVGAAQANPWIEKLAPETELYSGYVSDLGFDHVIDVLKQDVQSGRIRPEQLNKVSMEQAVRRTYEYDQEMAKKMREAAIKATEGFPTYKEYPKGYRWIELKVPDRPLPEGYTLGGGNDKFVFDPSGKDVPNPNYKALEDALKYEGEAMGHCVGGYCPDVIEGRSRIFSLRDAKGEPHVTVEVEPLGSGVLSGEDLNAMEPGLFDKFLEQRYADNGIDNMHKWLSVNRPELALQDRIVQIKGKQNRAPKDEYLPFVQDFVRSGKWSDVGDIQNTGMRATRDIFNETELQKLRDLGQADIPHIMSGEDIQRYHNMIVPEGQRLKYDARGNVIGLEGAEGMARGGRVHISDNPDVMQLELQAGGLVKGLKAAVKAAKAGADAPIVEAPSIIIPSKIQNVREAVRKSEGNYGAKRVERAADEIRNLERMYTEKALKDVFTGDNAKAVVTMSPADFERYAEQLRGRTQADIGPKMAELAKQGEINKYTVPTDEYIQHLMRVQGGFDQVPYLNLYKDEVGLPMKPEVRGHEGRHRNRALAEAGEPSALVEINPRGDLREGLPRSSQEEYIEALREELGLSDRLVLPQTDGTSRRPAIILPEPYAEGGEVNMAAGGLSKLAKLARAPAKSKREIQAIAERIAPQVTGEYVRESAKSAKTAAGKTQKQFEREKTLPVDVRPTEVERIPETIDIEKFKDELMIGIPGDPTMAGKTLYGVGGVKLGSPSPQHGGPLYGLYNNPNFWASGEDAAKKVQNLARSVSQLYDAPVLGNYIMMGPDSLGYAQHFADANLQAIDLSKMTKEQIEKFNEIIREGYRYKKGNEHFQRVFPSFPGIEDKDSAYLHMAMDPDLRKHFNEVMQKPTVTKPLNLPSGQDIRFAITEPVLRDLESGVTGYSIGRMRPDITPEGLKLSQHPTYTHDIPGEFLGTSRYPMPYELTFPDTVKSIRENPKQAPYEFGTLQYGSTHQKIDQQLIDEIKTYNEYMKRLTGKKKGGAVTKDEQRVQNPVHFTENPDVMRLALSKRN